MESRYLYRQPAILVRDASRPLHWISTDSELNDACADLRTQTVIGLDVETTLYSRALCLVQLATSSETYVVDPFEVSDLGPFRELMSDGRVTKVIHNAAFERAVLARYAIHIANVIDTMMVSRKLHGRRSDGGHSLRAVCEREFGVTMDKREQKGDWTRRPLTERQLTYAALDAEVLVRLYNHFERLALTYEPPGAGSSEVGSTDENG